MNKTTIKVLQEIIRNKNFSVESAAEKLGKARTTIYDCLAELRKSNILDKRNHLEDNELTNAYKKLFLTYPYDFSFLSKNNIRILLLLEKEMPFTEIIQKSKLSRYTVNQLLKELKNRGFLNKKNKLVKPPELLSLLRIIKKTRSNNTLKLPNTAVIIKRSEKRDLIQATKETSLNLKPTAFSAFNVKIISPLNYYTTKKRVCMQDIFNDAKEISQTKREILITALFYYKNKKKLKKNICYEEIINSKEFEEFKENA